ncbi:hypothetical protein CHUAL_000799 [Chamberlinius hualienensis]
MILCCFERSAFAVAITSIIICNALTNLEAERKKKDGPDFNFRCFCSSGFYEKTSVAVFASTDICSDYEDVEKALTANSTNKLKIEMKICHPCVANCLECKGPEAEDCLKCNNGYLSVTPIDEDLLKSEQLIRTNTIDTVDDELTEEYSGNGPLQNTRIVRCVSICPEDYIISDNNSSCEYCGTKCNMETTASYVNVTEAAIRIMEEKVTPAGYYAIPPLIILGVGIVIAIAYVRKKRRIASNTWKNENIVIRQGSNVESKMFLSANHKSQPISDYRIGNPYVFVDRPLPHHPLHQGIHGGSAASGWSTDHDDLDGLYETPENRKCHYLKATSPTAGHSISSSLDDCRHHNFRHGDKNRHTKPRSGSLESNHPPKKHPGHSVKRQSLDGIEVPNYHAPPAPVRHISSATKRRLHNDHIYVNVEESN